MSATERILEDLASGQADNVEDAARKEERLLRRFFRRSAEKRLREAHVRTNKVEAVHVARVARILGASGRSEDPVDLDDEASVLTAWNRVPKPKGRGLPLFTLLLCLLLGATPFVVLLVRTAMKPFDPTRMGVGRSLHANLTNHVTRVTSGERFGPEQSVARVFALDRGKLGDSTTLAFERFFGAYEAAADDSKTMPRLYVETRNVNRALQDRGLPFYLDTKLWAPKKPIIYSYYIEREDHASAPGFASERIVFLWRLDRLNITKAAMGYTHREADAALVLYDQIESFLIRDVLPALSNGEKVELIDDASRDAKKAWQEDIEQRSARMVRESFVNAADRESLAALGELLAKRRKIVAKWRTELASQRIMLHPPDRLIPEADYVKDLWLLVPAASRTEWDNVHDALQSKHMIATFESLRDRFARDVARHELQHRFDAQRTKECQWDTPCEQIKIPSEIAKRTGFSASDKPIFGTMPVRVWDETSAYLSEMAFEGSMPKMSILSILRSVLDRDAWGDAYCTTAIVLLEALAEEFGIADAQYPLVVSGYIQRGAVSSLVVLLYAKTDAELRTAAAKAWSKLYGSVLPAPTMTLGHQGKHWRH